MQLKELLKDLEYTLICGNLDAEISDLTYDSRKVTKGTAFICMTGSLTDGHDYIQSAYDKGARVFFVEKDVKETMATLKDITVIYLENTRQNLSYLSAAFFGHPAKKLITIALTGTKGKTITSCMIRNILERAGKKTGLIGTMGVFIGDYHEETKNTTPESYDIQSYLAKMVEENCEYVVMEVSSQALKTGRCNGLMFDYAIFTNLSPDHIGGDEHADYEEYIFCKSLLFKQCRHGIFNIDDKQAQRMMQSDVCDKKTYGFDAGADLMAKDIQYISKPGFIGIQFRTEGCLDEEIRVNIPGRFNAYNAMAATLLSLQLGIDTDTIKQALSNCSIRGRVEMVPVSKQFTVLIDYAHNGMSMESLLTTIREYQPPRIVSLFGCGGNRSKVRRYEMGEISGKYADFSILTADNSRFEAVEDILEDIKVGMHKTDGEYIVIPDRKEAIKYSFTHAKKGDIVLLLGKGHETYQEINGERFPFDERVIIQEILKELESEGTKWLQ